MIRPLLILLIWAEVRYCWLHRTQACCSVGGLTLRKKNGLTSVSTGSAPWCLWLPTLFMSCKRSRLLSLKVDRRERPLEALEWRARKHRETRKLLVLHSLYGTRNKKVLKRGTDSTQIISLGRRWSTQLFTSLYTSGSIITRTNRFCTSTSTVV